MKSILRLNYSLYNSNPNLLVLLTLLSCALLVDVSVAKWVVMPPSIMIMFILLCLQYINFRFWWASLSVILLYIAMLGPDFPRLANHGNLALFICLAIVFFYTRRLFTRKSIDGETISKCFRYSLVTIYFIAGFHKLNAGFFTISGSCSTYVTQGFNIFLFNKPIIYPDYIVRILQIGTIVIEMIIPFGILFQKTRFYSAWILIIFHLYLSLCGFSNFSAFALFLIVGSVLNLNERVLSKNVKQGLWFYVLIAVSSSLIAYLFKRFGLSTRQTMLTVNGIVLNIGIIYICYIILKKNRNAVISYNATILPFLCVMLLTVWGLQGYIGLSNTSTITMFSNLITEQSRCNHFIINTARTKIWNFEEDYLTIIKLPETEKEWGKYYQIKNYDVPLLEFKKIAQGWVKRANGRKMSCIILYKGEYIKIEDLATSIYSKSVWWYKLLNYRRIPKKGLNECMW